MNRALRGRWSAVAIVPRGEQYLVVARNFQPKDVNFPGGNSEPGDRTPKDTAIRELLEETGVGTQPEFVQLMDKWRGADGEPVYAFFVTAFTGRERSSDEGKAFWTSNLTSLTAKQSTFRVGNKRLLKKLLRLAS